MRAEPLATDAKTAASAACFERVLLQSSLEGDIRPIVSMTSGLVKANIDAKRIREVNEATKDNLKNILQMCGANKFASTGQ